MAKRPGGSRKREYDCAILGGGPAGRVAALYLRRFRRSVALFEGGKPRAAWIPKTHNLLGYDRGISGVELLERLDRQLRCHRRGGDFLRVSERAVIARDRARGGFEVRFGRGRKIFCRRAILATGIQDEQPAIPNLDELRRKGLLRYCSICDGFEFRGEPLAVLARDDEGIKKALFLRHWSSRLSLLLPEGFELAPVRARELERAGIPVLRTAKLALKAAAPGLRIELSDGQEMRARAAYVELGCRVNDEGFRQLRGLRRSTDGFLITTLEQRTSVPGLFAIGDCVNLLGQLSVAAGQAAVAATAVHEDLIELDEKRWRPGRR